MTLSIGAATDYLVATATTAVAGMTVNGEPVAVVDGWPDELVFGMVVVGLSDPPPEGGAAETDGTRAASDLGNLWVDDDYTIPCYIDVRVPGNVQKTARDLAGAVFEAFWTAVRADLTLGGLLRQPGRAEIATLSYAPSNVGTVAEPGRRQLVRFGVRCTSLTTT